MDALLAKILRRSPGPTGPAKRVRSSAVLAVAREMPPGQMLLLADRDGREFAVLDYEDMLHFLDLAGLTVRGAR